MCFLDKCGLDKIVNLYVIHFIYSILVFGKMSLIDLNSKTFVFGWFNCSNFGVSIIFNANRTEVFILIRHT